MIALLWPNSNDDGNGCDWSPAFLGTSCWPFLSQTTLDLAVSLSPQWCIRWVSHWLCTLAFLGPCSQCSSGPFFTLYPDLPLSQAAVFLPPSLPLTALSLVS